MVQRFSKGIREVQQRGKDKQRKEKNKIGREANKNIWHLGDSRKVSDVRIIVLRKLSRMHIHIERTDTKEIRLNFIKIGDAGFSEIMECKAKKVEFVDLISCGLTFRSISSLTDWQKLKYLRLKGNKIGITGIRTLEKMALWPQLCMLDLQSCNIGDEGVKNLHKTNFPELKRLNLSFNKITNIGAIYLLKLISFYQLDYLNISRNQIAISTEQFLKANTHSMNTIRNLI